MKKPIFLLALGLVLTMTVFTSLAWGEDTPVSLVSVSGNESVLSSGINGTYQCIVSTVYPNATITTSNNTYSEIVGKVLPKEPCNAAISLTGTDGNKSVFLVKVNDSQYFPENQTLSLNISPLKFYDGTLLQEFQKKKGEIQPGEFSITQVYLEIGLSKMENNCVCAGCCCGCAEGGE